jgi:hypothetical protein
MSGSSLPDSSVRKNFWTRIPLSFRILGAVALGIATGALLGQPNPAPWQPVFLNKLGDISKLFIDLLKALATPLIFFAVIDALVRTHIPPRKGFKMICISLSTRRSRSRSACSSPTRCAAATVGKANWMTSKHR